MTAAQRDLLLVLDLRAEGLAKVASLVRTALGGQAKQASTPIAGDMEIFLASDVIYSQRVAPLIQQTLAANGIQGLSTASSRFLPNIGWLERERPSSRASPASRPAPPSGQAVTGQPRQRAEGRERGHQHARSRTDAQPHQRRRQPDLHRPGRKLRRIPRRRTSRST